MLYDVEEVDLEKQYCGIIRSVNENGVIVEFCNNIRGILPKPEIKMQEMEIKQTSIGKSIEVYLNHIKVKKNFVTLSLIPPMARNKGKTDKKNNTNK